MWYYRAENGEVLGAGQSVPQDSDWLERYATALGLPVGSIVQFESETDPRPPGARTEPKPAESQAVIA